MNSSLKITLVFLAFGIAWIYFSGVFILSITGNDTKLYHEIELYKGLFFIFVSAGLIYLVSWHLHKSLNKANQDLKISNQLLSELAEEKVKYQKAITQAILRAEEEERKQIGAELHDNVSQILATTKLYLNLACENPAKRDELIQKSSDNILEVITELRKLCKSLNPSTLGDVGLMPTIEDLAMNISKSTHIKIDLNGNNFSEDKVNKDIKLIIYRIIQEQLVNIVRHSNAKNIVIELESGQSSMGLTIQDDGKGFDPRNESQNTGLRSIRNRTELFNGSMNIISAPGKGCTLHIEIGKN